eukprot:m51a1_g10678 putative adenylate guanylate cyclase (1095) ;mRNA; f:68772-73089
MQSGPPSAAPGPTLGPCYSELPLWEQVSVSRLTQRFRWPGIERAYCQHHETLYSSKSAVCAFALLSLAVLFAFAMVSGLRSGGMSACADRLYVYVGSGCAALLLAFLALRFVLGGLLVASQELVYLVVALAFVAEMAAAFDACPRFDFVVDDAHMPPSAYPVLTVTLVSFVFVLCGAVPWPRSALFVAPVALLELAVVVRLMAAQGAYMWVLLLQVLGTVFSLVFAVFVSWDRRSEYANLLLIERERRQAVVERSVTHSLIKAIFPGDVAEQLIAARGLREAAGPPSPLQMTPRFPAVCRAYQRAAVVYMTVAGLDSVGQGARQLEALSRVFISTDALVGGCSATKIKSVGSSLLFVCGVPRELDDCDRSACALGEGLMDLMDSLRRRYDMGSVALQVGIAMGPLVAGVIGVSRPRYDCWGYTVSVARKLSTVAAPGEILVTRDVAKKLRSVHRFQLRKDLTHVEGIGNILLFRLMRATERFSTQLYNMEAVEKEVVSPLEIAPRRWVHLDELFGKKEDQSIAEPPLSLVASFLDFGREVQFLSYYARHYYLHVRWILFTMGCFFLLFHVLAIAMRVGQTLRYAAASVAIAVLFAASGLTWLPSLRERPLLYYSLFFGLLCADSALFVVLWDLGGWNDSLMSGFIAWICALHCVRVPFVCAAFLSVMSIVCSIPIYKVDSAVIVVALEVCFLVINAFYELRVRRIFRLTELLNANRELNEKEKRAADLLLSSVIPEAMSDMLGTTLHSSDELYYAHLIPSATVLVCTIVDFDRIYRVEEPSYVVQMLNALFSQLDSLVESSGLTPLKTNADEYIVVGNLLGDSPRHADLVSGLACAILEVPDTWQRNHPDCPPISLRVGVHSDVALTGVIKMKSFLVDCWGPAVPVAERLCSEAPADCAVVSAATASLLTQPIALAPFHPVQLGGAALQTSLLRIGAREPVAAALDLEVEVPRIAFEPVGGVDYGVFTGDDACDTACPTFGTRSYVASRSPRPRTEASSSMPPSPNVHPATSGAASGASGLNQAPDSGGRAAATAGDANQTSDSVDSSLLQLPQGSSLFPANSPRLPTPSPSPTYDASGVEPPPVYSVVVNDDE